MTSPPTTGTAPERPVWTKERLARVLILRFGFTKTGGPDTTAAAAEMGVSRRTVQRWLHADSPTSPARIPAARIEQLTTLMLPSQETRVREEQQARYARNAIAGLRLPRKMGVNPAWEQQRWLDPHLVVVLEVQVGQLTVRQVSVGHADTKTATDRKRRGTIVDQAVVPTRFHATLLVHRVLAEVAPWRLQARKRQVRQGFTWTWLADSPPTALTAWADQIIEETA